MRVYMRMGRGGGISVGPIGLLVLAPLYLGYMAVVVMFYLLAILLRVTIAGGVLVFGGVAALAKHLQERRASEQPTQTTAPPPTPTRHLTGLDLRVAAERERQERLARQREALLDQPADPS